MYDPEVGEKPQKPVEGVSADAQGLLGCFKGSDPLSADALSELTALDYPALAPILMELEFSGKITRLPGGLYIKRAF
jgi:predicted Rossmann fold nucleotide-binding protein DprA/Smf involved in DNA uptake